MLLDQWLELQGLRQKGTWKSYCPFLSSKHFQSKIWFLCAEVTEISGNDGQKNFRVEGIVSFCLLFEALLESTWTSAWLSSPGFGMSIFQLSNNYQNLPKILIGPL